MTRGYSQDFFTAKAVCTEKIDELIADIQYERESCELARVFTEEDRIKIECFDMFIEKLEDLKNNL